MKTELFREFIKFRPRSKLAAVAVTGSRDISNYVLSQTSSKALVPICVHECALSLISSGVKGREVMRLYRISFQKRAFISNIKLESVQLVCDAKRWVFVGFSSYTILISLNIIAMRVNTLNVDTKK